MAFVGVLMAIVGLIGFVLTWMGVMQLTGIFGNPTPWAVLGVAGVVLYFLKRRPSD